MFVIPGKANEEVSKATFQAGSFAPHHVSAWQSLRWMTIESCSTDVCAVDPRRLLVVHAGPVLR
jgi:hypothetical protein